MPLRRTSSIKPPPDNPFIRRAEESTPAVEPLTTDDWLGVDVAARGPQHPLTLPSGPATGVLARREITAAGVSVCVAGAHGGAGASTVAALLGSDAFDAGVGWPVAVGGEPPVPVLPVVVVARTHGAGLAAAERVAHSWAAGDLGESRLLGVVLVDDAPQLTKAQKAAARRLSQMTPHGWHIAWQPAWRELTVPDAHGLPVRVRRTLEHIRKLSAPPADPRPPQNLTSDRRPQADETESRRVP